MRHTYFIGYDAREHEAALVCAYSIASRCAWNVPDIYFLEHRELRTLGKFDRPWQIDEGGQLHDLRDGRPFSTEFSHSRFLAPHLADELGCTGPCMFVDCDFLFLADPSTLMAGFWESGLPLGTCKREREPTTAVKMDGVSQVAYARKLWSAMFLFRPGTSEARLFTPERVNSMTGQGLHRFFELGESQFYDVSHRWHYVPGMDDTTPDRVHAVHFSEFSPWLNPGHPDGVGIFELWHREHRAMVQSCGRACTGLSPHVRSLTNDLEERLSRQHVTG